MRKTLLPFLLTVFAGGFVIGFSLTRDAEREVGPVLGLLPWLSFLGFWVTFAVLLWKRETDLVDLTRGQITRRLIGTGLIAFAAGAAAFLAALAAGLRRPWMVTLGTAIMAGVFGSLYYSLIAKHYRKR